MMTLCVNLRSWPGSGRGEQPHPSQEGVRTKCQTDERGSVLIERQKEVQAAQTLKSGAKSLSRPSQNRDSDGNCDDDQRVPPISARAKIKEIIVTTKRSAATEQNDETNKYVLKRLTSRGKKN